MREAKSVINSLRMSFKSPRNRSPTSSQEQLPILSEPLNTSEIVVKIDEEQAIHQENRDPEQDMQNTSPSLDTGFSFRNSATDDPPSKLIDQFLHKQKASGEVALDFDLEMEELRAGRSVLPPIRESPKEHPNDLKVSFQTIPPGAPERQESLRRRVKGSAASSSSDEEDPKEKASDSVSSGETITCTSNAAFSPTSLLLRTRTKSRLLDPPQQFEDRTVLKSGQLRSGQLKSGQLRSGQLKSGQLRSGQVKSGVLRSGLLSARTREEEEEDPFLEEDVPDAYKKVKIGALAILEWVSLIIILASLACSLTIPVLTRQTVWDLHLWKWEVLVLVLICGRLVSGWWIRIAVFFIEFNFLLRKRVLYFVYGIRRAVRNCIWLGLVLIAWHFMFDDKVEKTTRSDVLPYVTKVLVCLLVGTLIWLVKTLLVKVLASSFHVNAFFDRIQDALFNQYVIKVLSGPPLIEIQNINEEEERVMVEIQKLQNAGARMPPELKAAALPTKSGRVIASGMMQRSPRVGKSVRFSDPGTKKQDEGITIDHLHRLNQKNISAWNMKRLMNIVRRGALSTLDEKVMGLSQGYEEDESELQIRSELEAKRAAKKIFTNVAKPGSKYIYLADLMRFMIEDEALKTMGLFEGATDTKRVSKTALKNWVIEAFRERRALALTLNDTKTAVNKLHQMVNVVVGIIIVIIWLLILGIATTHFFVLISSQILLVVFIFGNTCKMIFEAIIFLFVMHPYDVGDRCEIDGVQVVVEEMNILTTVFLRYDNQKIIYPNSVLATKPISNYYRSPDMGDAIDFVVHLATPVEKIARVKERIVGFVQSKKEHWAPDPMVVMREIEDMNKLRISVWLTHRMNHQNMGERWVRREFVVQEMIKVFRELDIEYRMVPLDVNLRTLPPLTSDRLPSTWSK